METINANNGIVLLCLRKAHFDDKYVNLNTTLPIPPVLLQVKGEVDAIFACN